MSIAAPTRSARPILWHIEISHYSEKVRWALEYKWIDHTGRMPMLGFHPMAGLLLTRGAQPTLPVLELDGRRIGDSTAIIAALEERFPLPPLYPEDAEERRRALDLEDWFDESLGPLVRRLFFHETTRDPAALAQLVARQVPVAPPGPAARIFTSFVTLRYGVGDADAASSARREIAEAMDRLEDELDRSRSDYLVGDRFTIADLTAAALFYPVVLPPEGPRPPEIVPAGFERFRATLADRPGYRWVQEMFSRHRRGPAPATTV